MTRFLLAMIAHPEKQMKCQEELERVIGRSRMPTLADKNSLPYTRATVRELLRWRPVTPLGEPCPKMDGYQVKLFRNSGAAIDGGTIPNPSIITHGDTFV